MTDRQVRKSTAPSKSKQGNEYEPRDSRNVTGTAATPDGRWTNDQKKPPSSSD